MMYLATYLCAACLVLATTPIAIRLARRLALVDLPNVRNVHLRPVSRIGGVTIFLSTTCTVVASILFSGLASNTDRDALCKLAAVLYAGALMFLVGLVDDVWPLRARTKLLAQTAAAVVLCLAAVRIESFTASESLTVTLGWLSWPVTILWIVGITNAVNLSDGLDGLAAGISAIACAVIALVALFMTQDVQAIPAFALLGSLCGFLYFNFHPATIFMGDCGSMFVGFLIAASTVLCSSGSRSSTALGIPLLALGVPVLDTAFSMLRRVVQRRRLFAPDRGHFHHRLLDIGLTHSQAVIVTYIATATSAALGLFMLITEPRDSMVVLCCVLFLLTVVFRSVGSVRLSETIAGLRRNHALKREMEDEQERFEYAQLHLAQAMSFEQWWQAVAETAQQMGFSKLILALTERDGGRRTLLWQNAGEKPARDADLLTVDIPLRDRRFARHAQIKMAVRKNGSLESAARKVTLFVRLMDEHGLASLPPSNENHVYGSPLAEMMVRWHGTN